MSIRLFDVTKSFGFVALFLALLWASGGAAQSEQKPQIGLAHRMIEIERQGQDKPLLAFDVELPKTRDQEIIGLMFRTEVPVGTGMLFPVSPPMPVAFWMKNTLVPLDMIFIREDGTIANIAHKTKPRDLTPVPSEGPVAYVLEIKGGEAARLGIKAGDKVR